MSLESDKKQRRRFTVVTIAMILLVAIVVTALILAKPTDTTNVGDENTAYTTEEDSASTETQTESQDSTVSTSTSTTASELPATGASTSIIFTAVLMGVCAWLTLVNLGKKKEIRALEIISQK